MTSTTESDAERLYLDKMALYRHVGWTPHKGQLPIVTSPARFRVASAGRRFGKSDIGGHEVVPEVFTTFAMRSYLEDVGKRREFWIVGPEYSDAEKEFRVAYDTMRRLDLPFDRPGTYNDPHGGDMNVSLWGGRFLLSAKSAKYPGTLVGEGLSGVVMAEAAKIREVVWTRFLRPTLADYRGWATMMSTPEGRNWFYRAWQNGQDQSQAEWASWRLPSWLNPHVYPLGKDDPEIASLRRDMTSAAFAQEIGADFSEFVGRVFKEFDEEINVADLDYRPDWETFAAVDYGFTNPFVWLLIQVGPFGDVHVLREMYRTGLTIPEIAKDIRANNLAPDSLSAFYPDPAQPGDTRELSEYLKVAAKSGGGGELKDRLNLIRKALEIPEAQAKLPDGHPERIPKLRIDRSCVELIREFGAYRYPRVAGEAHSDKANPPEAPLKKDDHGPEALGRFFKGYFGATARTSTTVRRSRMTRR